MTSPSLMHAALDRLAAAWRQAGSPVGDHLAPPRSEAEIRRALDEAGLDSPAEILEWFTWHDGTNPAAGSPRCRTSFSIGGDYYLTLQECLGELEVWRSISDDTSWQHSWFPLLRNAGGDPVVAVVDRGSPCAVGRYNATFDFALTTHSLVDLVICWAERIENGRWLWTEGGGVRPRTLPPGPPRFNGV